MAQRPATSLFVDLLQSLFVVGSANLVSVGLGVLRIKLVALLFGPAGVGLWGILSNTLNVISTVAGLGIPTSAVRQIASSQNDKSEVEAILFVLTTTVLFQGLLAVGLITFFQTELADLLFESAAPAWALPIIALAAFFALLSIVQMSILQGQQRMKLLSKGTVAGAVAGTSLGCLILATVDVHGILLFVLVQPICGFLMMAYYTRKAPIVRLRRRSFGEVWRNWKVLAQLGIPLMMGIFVQMATVLMVRSLITRQLGLVEAGFFAATWSITMHYIGFLFNAMGADYYPRLSKNINDPSARDELINRQIQLGLVLCIPLLMAMMILAPWIMAVFYTADFVATSDILRWQLAGNVLKLLSWPLAFLLIASHKPRWYFFSEILFNASFLFVISAGLSDVGLIIVGYGFCFSYGLYLFFLGGLLITTMTIKITPMTYIMALAAVVCVAAVLAICLSDISYGNALGSAITALVTLSSVAFLAQSLHKQSQNSKLARLFNKIFRRFNNGDEKP